MNLNWVDAVILAFLLIFALDGLGKRLFPEFISLFSFVISFLLGLRFYNFVAQLFEKYLQLPHSLANVLGFIAIWYFIEALVVILVNLFSPKIKNIPKLPGEGLLTVLVSFLRGVLVVAVLLVLFATFPVQPQVKLAVSDSTIGSKILKQTYLLEGPIKNVFGGLANDTLSFLTIKPKTDETVDLGFRNSDFFYNEKMEFTMIELVNQERTKMGLKLLKFDSKLRNLGRLHSADMFKRGYFSHYSPEGKSVGDRAQSQGVMFLVIGENLAYAPSLEFAHQGLMNSPGHRANILSEDYNKIGIGVADSKQYGLMFTQVFSN